MIRKIIFSVLCLSFLSSLAFAQNPNPPLCVPISSSESGVLFGVNITSHPQSYCAIGNSCPPFDCNDGTYTHRWCAAYGGATCVGGTAVTPPAPFTELKIYSGGTLPCDYTSNTLYSDITWSCPVGKIKGGGITYNGGPQFSASSYSSSGLKCF